MADMELMNDAIVEYDDEALANEYKRAKEERKLADFEKPYDPVKRDARWGECIWEVLLLDKGNL